VSQFEIGILFESAREGRQGCSQGPCALFAHEPRGVNGFEISPAPAGVGRLTEYELVDRFCPTPAGAGLFRKEILLQGLARKNRAALGYFPLGPSGPTRGSIDLQLKLRLYL
jgi:hypothetical protein